MASESQLRAIEKYQKANVKAMTLKLNKKTDADILEFLETQDSKMGIIKQCIREHMKREKRK